MTVNRLQQTTCGTKVGHTRSTIFFFAFHKLLKRYTKAQQLVQCMVPRALLGGIRNTLMSVYSSDSQLLLFKEKSDYFQLLFKEKSDFQLLLLLLLFLTFSVLVASPKKTTLHGGQSRSWSAEQGKENKRKSLAAYPPPPTPHTARSEKINKITRQALRRSWSVSRSYKDTFGSSTRPMGVASQNPTLSSAIIRCPVSLLLSSPGDV